MIDIQLITQVIVRSTLPVHFVTASGTGFASDVEGDIWRCLTRVPHPVPHPTNYFLLDMVRRHGFRFLDSFPIYYERGDMTREDKIDCFHHCYTPELVWPELVLLTQLIKHWYCLKMNSFLYLLLCCVTNFFSRLERSQINIGPINHIKIIILPFATLQFRFNFPWKGRVTREMDGTNL